MAPALDRVEDGAPRITYNDSSRQSFVSELDQPSTPGSAEGTRTPETMGDRSSRLMTNRKRLTASDFSDIARYKTVCYKSFL